MLLVIAFCDFPQIQRTLRLHEPENKSVGSLNLRDQSVLTNCDGV